MQVATGCAVSGTLGASDASREPARGPTPSRRAERRRPGRSHRSYWHLTQLERALRAGIARHLLGREPGLVLDYGCGDAPYRELFAGWARGYLACDLPGNPVADVRLAPQAPLPFRAGCAGAVLSSQVLEHVPDPMAYLAECRRVLRPGGRLLLSTHGVWRFHPDPADLWRWTSQGLRRVLETAGFQVLDFEGIQGPAATGLQLLQDAWLPALPRLVQPVFRLAFQLTMELCDRLGSAESRRRDAAVYLVVATPAGDPVA